MSTSTSPSERAPLLSGRGPTTVNDNDNDGLLANANGTKDSSQTVTGVTANNYGTSTSHDHESASDNGSIDAERAAQFSGNAAVRKQLKFVVPAISIGVFLGAADQTIIVSSYGRIGSDLHALNLTSWIATSYLLSLTSFQPLYGRLSDIFGRKPCLLFTYAVFGLGGLLCGLSQSIEQLIAARVFQGIGGGGMAVVVSVMFSDIVPLQERGVWQGVINIIFAVGAASGAPLGGYCSDVIGWRWTFLIQAPISLLALVVVAIVLKLPKREPQDWRLKLKRIDFLGAIVLISAVFSLLFGMDRGSNVSWAIPECYATLAASALLFALLIYIELRVATEPFAPGHVVFGKSMCASYLCYFFNCAGFLALQYYISLYFQAVNNASATAAGVRLLPSVMAAVIGSLLAGFIMKRTGKYRHLTIITFSMFTISVIPIFLFSGAIADNLTGIIVGTVIGALGEGAAITSTLISLIAVASPADQAVATACSYLFRSLGSTVGVALGSTVVQQVLRSTLRHDLGSGKEASEIERNVRESLDYLKQLDPEVQDVVRHAYGLAVRHSYVLMFFLALTASVASFFIQDKRLNK